MSKTNQPIEDDIYLEILTLGLIGKLSKLYIEKKKFNISVNLN